MVIDSQKNQELRSEAQVIRGVINALRSTPSSVREYSTRGGISAKASLLMILSSSSSLSLEDKTVGLIPGHYLERPFPAYSMDYSLQRTETNTIN
jgi:hypothetical protein